MMPTSEWAAKYITDLGFALVPIPPGTKGPRGNGWNQPGNYFTDPDTARRFFEGHSDYGMGAVLGPSRIVVWDIDDPGMTRTLLETLGYDFETIVAGAPRLQGNPARDKYFFRAPVGVKLSRHALAWPHPETGDRVTVFELRAGGVQDVLPPSVHPEIGKPYRWISPPDRGFPEVPALLLNLWLNWRGEVENLKGACPWAQKPESPTRKVKKESAGGSVIESFNATHDIASILDANRYTKKGKNRFLSPHSQSGMPGVVLLDDGDAVFCHHGADPLGDGHSHDAFDVYRILEHNGDFTKATKAAAEMMGMVLERKTAEVRPIREGVEVQGSEPEQADEVMEVKTLTILSAAELIAYDFPNRPNLLSPWLPSQGLAMVYAGRGVGKTYFALDVAVAVASGSRSFRWEAPEPRGVLYLDGEMPGPVLQERLCRLVDSRDIDDFPAPLRFAPADLQAFGTPKLDTPEGQALVQPHLDGIDLIIVDNISTLTAGNNHGENEGESWLPVQQWALRQRAAGKTVLFIHHSGKSGDQRGTSRREDVLDTVIQLKHPADYKASDGARFEVHFKKARRVYGEALEPFEAALVPDADGALSWHIRSQEESATEQVARHLMAGVSQAEIAIDMGISRTNVAYHVKRAKESGLVPEDFQIPDGRRRRNGS